MNIFLTHKPSELNVLFPMQAVEELRKLGRVTSNPHERRLQAQEIYELVPDVEIIISEWATGIDRSFMEKAKRLKAFIRSGVEIRNVDMQAAKEHGVMVLNTPGHYVQPVVELVLCYMVALSRNLMRFNNGLKSGTMMIQEHWPELAGKKLGIIGMGAIGRKLSVIADVLGMRVIAYDPFVQNPSEHVQMASFEQVLAESDFVSLHAGWTVQTERMIGPAEFQLMKPSCYFINTSRAALVDERALYEVLVSGKIAGAALDVFSNEPAIVGNPLVDLSNVIVTPHIGGWSPETMQRQASQIVQMVKDMQAGLNPDSIVNG